MILVYSVLVHITACASVGQRRAYFYETQNEYIGRPIGDYWLAEPVGVDYEESEVIYKYANSETGCMWALITDKKSKVIKSWRYISDPDHCFEQINWRGPW